MEQDDEEFEQLLCEIPHATSTNTPNEIPRATSAPPHLEELQRVYGSEVEEGPFGLREDEVSVKPFIDIRCDEQYENFYKSYSGGKKLPPPMDNRTLYNDLPVLSPKSASNQLSPFFAGLTLDSPRTRHRKHRQLEMQISQQQHQHAQQQHSQLQQREATPNHLAAGTHHFGNPSQNQMFADTHLTSAFGNLNFDENSTRGMQSRTDETTENRVLSNGSNGGPIMSNGHGPAVSNGIYGHLDSFGAGSGSYGAGSLESYGPRLPPSMDLFPKMSAGGMEGISEGIYNGMNQYSQTQVIEKMLRQGSPVLDVYSTVRAGSAPLDNYGPGGSSPYQQQQQLDAVAAAMQVAAAHGHSAPASSNDYYSTVQKPYIFEYEMASLIEAQRAQAQAQAQAAAAAVRYVQEEEKRKQQQRLINQQQLTDQQNRMQLLAALQAQVNGGANGGPFPRGVNPSTAGPRSSLGNSQSIQQKLRQQQVLGQEGVWGGTGLVQPDNSRMSPTSSLCRYYSQGYCSRGEACPFLHPSSHGMSVKDAARMAAAVTREAYPEKIPRRSPRAHAAGATTPAVPTGIRRKVDVVGNGHAQSHPNGYSNSHRSPGSGHISPPYMSEMQVQSRTMSQDNLDFEVESRLMTPHLLQQQQQPKYTKLEEVEGRIYSIAKDQHGCRFLQKKFDEGGPEDVNKIFDEIIGHITELMKDPFGNYLVQKLLEVCDEQQRMEILHVVTLDGELVKISLNMHGTRAVQKLIETLKSAEQVVMVITALSDGVVELIKDLNGNHVVQRCLQKLSHEDSQFIFDAAAAHCVEISTHRHGCCVMQRCVDSASPVQKQRLVAEVGANALVLSQDPYGNYVVQYVLDLKTAWSSTEVMLRLEGNYSFLAMQKFSSNVVEKCLKLGVEEHCARLVRELTASPRLGQLLQDQYANYVVQSALSVCKGPLHSGLVDAIRPHLPALRNSPYGKRILSRTNIKK